nr:MULTISPECIES: baseplate J/gp47 family protein [Pantoea]
MVQIALQVSIYMVQRTCASQADAVPPVETEMENDDAFCERIQLSWTQMKTAGGRIAYRFHAKSTDRDVLDAGA